MKRFALMLLLATLAVGQDEDPKVWVHVPTEDLLALFPKKGSGFLISIEEFEKLRALARKTVEARRNEPPLPGHLVNGTVDARVDGDVLRLEASYVAVVRADRPTSIPFGLEKIALERVAVEGGSFADGWLRFDKAGTYNVSVTMSARLDKIGDLRKADFRLPPATAHTVSLELPPNVEGEVGPIVRAFKSDDGGGRVIGYPDGSGLFRVWFRPRSPARSLDALLSASFDSVAEIGEARTFIRTGLRLDILRAPVAKVDLQLMNGQTVRALNGKGIKSWRLVRGADSDTLEVKFVDPVQSTVQLGLETELPRDTIGQAAIPLVRVPGAVRYRGTVGVGARAELKLQALRATGARRLDGQGKGGRLALFEIWSQTATVDATLARVAAETRARTSVLLSFHEGGKRLQAAFRYHIVGKPLFRLEPTLPAGWILREAQLNRKDIANRYEDGKLTLEFPGGLKPGNHVLFVTLETDEVDWVGTSPATFELAGLGAGLPEEAGHVVVDADPAFRVASTAVSGLRSVGMEEAAAEFGGVTERMLFAWRFEEPGYAARFTLERQAPQIGAVVVNELWPSERLLKVTARVLLDIRRAGVRELQVTLPAGTGKLVDFRGALIKERKAPAFEEGEPETWTIVFQRRVRGRYGFTVAFDKKFEEDTWQATAPAVRIPDAEESGFVVVHTSGMTALEVERDGLREADIGELPVPLSGAPLEVLAYAKHPYRVSIASRRHDPEAVVQAIALSADIYGVLSHDGRLRCRAEYRIRNNDQPFLRFALPKGSSLIGALVDGEPTKPLVEEGFLKVALPRSANRDTPFTIDVIYETRVGAIDDGDLAIARPALDIDVLKTTYKLHLPNGFELKRHDGDLVPLSERERRTVADVIGKYADLLAFPVHAQLGADEGPRSAPVATEAEPEEERLDWKANAEKFRDAGRYVGERTGAEAAAKKKSADARTELRSKSEDKAVRRLTRSGNRPSGDDADEDQDTIEDSPADSSEDAESGPRSPAEKAPAAGVPPAKTEPAPKPRDSTYVAHGGKDGKPTGDPGRAPSGKRARPERALLSLDVQFLRSDNIVVLDSLAPTGSVTVAFGRTESRGRNHFLGAVLGAAIAALALLTRRRSMLRILGALVFALVALHYAGLSFVPEDVARGAAEALLVAFLVLLPWRLLGRLVRGIAARFRRPKPAPIVALLIAAGLAQAGDEVLVPYSGDPSKVERVFLPAQEYHELRKLAYPTAAERGTVFTSAAYAGTLAGDDLDVKASYTIVKETAEAEDVLLALRDVAVSAATLDGKPARLRVTKRGYALVLDAKGRFALELTLRPRLEKSGERLSFRCPVRPVANARLTLAHDRAGHRVEVIGLGGETDGVHRIGPVGLLGATWIPETEGFRATAAELRARTEMRVSVRDGFTAVAARVHYNVSGGSVERVRLRCEPGLTVRSVACAGLAGWQREADGTVVVALAKPESKALVVTLLGERAATRERTEALPLVAPLDVLRDAGVIALDTLPDLKIEIVESQGLLRGRLDQAPGKLLAAPDAGVLQSVHRFALRPFQLRWKVSLARTRLRAVTNVDLFLQQESTFADVDVRIEVERGPGPFTVPITVPTGYTVEAVKGRVRDWWVDDGVLYLDRLERQTGAEHYRIGLRRRGATADVFAAPSVAVQGAVRQTGRVRVAVADGLDLRVGETANLLPEDTAKAGTVGWGRLVRAFRFVETPWSLALSTLEEPREMEALAVSRVVPLADRVLVEALVDFHVKRGLVDRFSFVVPVAAEREVLVFAPDRREITSEAVEGGRRFTVLLRTPTRGSTSATVTYHLPYGAPLRGVEPTDVGRIRRFVAVEKIADGEVRIGATRNLDAGDFEDLPLRPPESTPQSVARVFVGSGGPFALELDVKRHTFEEVAKAVVYRAGAEAVVDRSGFARVLVSYRIYNRSEQFLRLQLPSGSQLYSVLVAGQGVRPLGEGDDLLVPLRKLSLGASAFDVDVLYAYAGPKIGDRAFDVRLPEVKGLDVRRTTLTLWVPDGFDYSFETDMEEVEAADIAAGEVTQRYEEIKEAYAVTQRGNRIQKVRAFQNAQQLEQDAKRLMDQLRANTRDQAKLQQLESQEAAIKALQRANKAPRAKTSAATPSQQQGRGPRKLKEWAANDAYLKNNRAEDTKQIVAYVGRNFSQPENAKVKTDSGVAVFGFTTFKDVDVPKMATPPVLAGAVFARDSDGDGAVRDRATILGLPVFAGDDPGTAGVDNGGPGVPDSGLRLRGATGRISLRIDLEKKGKRYHFAYLGKDGGVSVDADEEGGVFTEALIALASAAAAALVLLWKRR